MTELLDQLFGRECFLNEVIWAYDYGARSKSRWPAKHDTILVYVKDPASYHFDSEAVDREPYMAPGLVTAEKAAKGKLPTDVWWHTIVSPTGASVGIGFAIPSDLARDIVAQLLARGRIDRGWLGVAINEGAKPSGVLVAGLDRDGPAARAGIRQGDVLLSVNGDKVDSANGLIRSIAAISPGSTARVMLRRQNREMELRVVVGLRPSEQDG